MFCSSCGKKLADGSKFCSGCGAKVGETTKNQPENLNTIPMAAQNYFNQAKEYEAKQDYKNAYDAYKSAVQIAPAFYEAQKKLAQVCINLQDTKQAGKILNDVISKNPDDYEAFYLRGETYSLLGKDEKALMDFDIALRINNNYIDSYKGIISVYKLRNDWDQIIKTANEAINVDSSEFFFYAARGEAYYRKNLIAEALTDFDKALEINHDDLEAIYFRGLILFGKEENDKALKDISHALKLFPENADCLFLRGKIHFANGEFKKSLSDFDFLINKKEKLREEVNRELYEYRVKARNKDGFYNKNPDFVMTDYLVLLKMKSDEQEKDPEIFIDIMISRYRKAVLDYGKEKKTYLLENTNPYNKEAYITIGSVINPSARFQAKRPIVFFDEAFADDFKKLIILEHIHLERAYSKNNPFKVVPNYRKDTPKYWFIIHAHTGQVYRWKSSEERKWSLTLLDESEEKQAEFRFESLEDALKTYEELIHTEHLGKKYEEDDDIEFDTFDWKFNDERHHDRNFMDLFIAGSY